MAMPQQSWDVEFLKNNPALQNDRYGIPIETRQIRYPIRMLRYWFMYHFLREEAARIGALDVCEIGVDLGQMREGVLPGEPPVVDAFQPAVRSALPQLARRDLLDPAQAGVRPIQFDGTWAT